MKTTGVAENYCPTRTYTIDELRRWNLSLQFLLRSIPPWSIEGVPLPELSIWALSIASPYVFEWTGISIDVTEVQIDLHHLHIFGIAVPVLRADAAAHVTRNRVPNVHVYKFRPHSQVRVHYIQHRIV
jgi:hypothetical protein